MKAARWMREAVKCAMLATGYAYMRSGDRLELTSVALLEWVADGVDMPTELAQRLGITPASVSLTLQRLEQAGYVLLRSDRMRDRRRVWVSLTPCGQRFLEAMGESLLASKAEAASPRRAA